MKPDPRVLDVRFLEIKNGKVTLPQFWIEHLGYPKSGIVKAQLVGRGFEVIGLMELCSKCGVPIIFGEHDEPDPYMCAICNREAQSRK